MKIELTGKVIEYSCGWMFDTEVNGKPVAFGKDNRLNSFIPPALDEILKEFGEPITESGQSFKITIERE